MSTPDGNRPRSTARSEDEGEQSTDWTSGSALGDGPFTEDAEDAPRKSWIAVGLMVIGFALVGLAIVLLNVTGTMPVLVVGISGVLVGMTGVVIGVRGRLMDNAE